MSSQLWQRLRAARRFADVTQIRAARAAGISRSGYAFYETTDDDSRTIPNAEQIAAIAQLTRVPVEWLLDDSVEADSVWQFSDSAAQRALAPRPGRPPSWVAPDAPGPERTPGAVQFAAAVGFVMSELHGGSFSGALFAHPRVLAGFSISSTSAELSLEVMQMAMLVRQRSIGATKKLLFVWRAAVDSAVRDLAKDSFGIEIRQVRTVEEAADYISGLL